MTQKHSIGAIAWTLSIQYYFIQILSASRWTAVPDFSWFKNTISDLGNTVCGPYGDRLVCSPLYLYMNISFIVLGLTQLLGSVLLWNYFSDSKHAKTGLIFFVLAGLGTILVGLFPENSIATLHIIGAALPFALGNIALLLIGLGSTKLPKSLKVFSVTLGLIGVIGLALFMTKAYLGLSLGGMERVVAYPQSVWMIVVGAYLVLPSKFRA